MNAFRAVKFRASPALPSACGVAGHPAATREVLAQGRAGLAALSSFSESVSLIRISKNCTVLEHGWLKRIQCVLSKINGFTMTFKEGVGTYFLTSGCIAFALVPKAFDHNSPLVHSGILYLWGIIPIIVGIFAIITKVKVSDRIFAWCMFLFGVVGVVLSCRPLRYEIFRFFSQ